MAEASEIEVRKKKEIREKQEQTVPGRHYSPPTDIYETAAALVVVMEMPGVDRKAIDIRLEHNELSIEGRIDFDKYKGFKPAYTEYNIGHYARNFRLSSEIDTSGIEAKVADGVLTLVLPKLAEARPRKIEIT